MADESLFPEDLDIEYDEEDMEESEEEVIGYKISPYFDMKAGDFLIGGNGQIATADGVESYIQWCEAILATDRYNHEAYTDDIGIDYDEIFAASDREEAELIIENEISEALACDPYGRTMYVQNVECEWTGPDEVNVSVEIRALDNELITVNKTISR